MWTRLGQGWPDWSIFQQFRQDWTTLEYAFFCQIVCPLWTIVLWASLASSVLSSFNQLSIIKEGGIGHSQLTLTALDHSGPLWTTLDNFGALWTILNLFRPLWTTFDNFGLLLTTLDRCGQVSTLQTPLDIMYFFFFCFPQTCSNCTKSRNLLYVSIFPIAEW